MNHVLFLRLSGTDRRGGFALSLDKPHLALAPTCLAQQHYCTISNGQMMESFPEKSSGACIGNGMNDLAIHFPQGQQAGSRTNSPTTMSETQPRPIFSRRNSMNASLEEGGDACCFETIGRNDNKRQNGNANELPRYSDGGSKPEKALARICGSSRSKCGYCGGDRLHVLSVRDVYNNNIICHSSKEHNGDVESPEAGKFSEQIDESRTSKSYGLLFDHIPFVTYEVLINRGKLKAGPFITRCYVPPCSAINLCVNLQRARLEKIRKALVPASEF